jgi:hypothetical protein
MNRRSLLSVLSAAALVAAAAPAAGQERTLPISTIPRTGGERVAYQAGGAESADGRAAAAQLRGNGAEARALLAEAIRTAPTAAARLQLMDAVSVSWLYDGDGRNAALAMRAMMDEAARAGRADLAAGMHLRLAMADGALGRGRSVGEFLAGSPALGTPYGQASAAMAYALAGQADSATAYAALFDRAARESGNAGMLASAHVVNGYAMLAGRRCGPALTEFSSGDQQSAMVLSGLSECYAMIGDRVQARQFRDQVMARTSLDLYDDWEALTRYRLRSIR